MEKVPFNGTEAALWRRLMAVVRARTSPRHTHGALDRDKPSSSAAHAQEDVYASIS